jgi:hypothetical protein
MKTPFNLAALVALLFAAIQAQGQSVTYTFSDGTSDGWATSGFGGTPLASVSNIGGNNYIFVPLSGSFQVANVSSGSGSAFYNAMLAAAADPAGYNISYNYYINTAAFGATPPTFLQLGTFVNTGSGYYAQDYSVPNEVQFSGTQLASGQVLSGTVTINMAAVGFNMPSDTFYRLGFIENGNNGSSSIGVYYTDISVTPVPEPSVISLCGLAATGLWMIRRRHLIHR